MKYQGSKNICKYCGKTEGIIKNIIYVKNIVNNIKNTENVSELSMTQTK